MLRARSARWALAATLAAVEAAAFASVTMRSRSASIRVSRSSMRVNRRFVSANASFVRVSSDTNRSSAFASFQKSAGFGSATWISWPTASARQPGQPRSLATAPQSRPPTAIIQLPRAPHAERRHRHSARAPIARCRRRLFSAPSPPLSFQTTPSLRR